MAASKRAAVRAGASARASTRAHAILCILYVYVCVTMHRVNRVSFSVLFFFFFFSFSRQPVVSRAGCSLLVCPLGQRVQTTVFFASVFQREAKKREGHQLARHLLVKRRQTDYLRVRKLLGENLYLSAKGNRGSSMSI